jgi:hypothetical protein
VKDDQAHQDIRTLFDWRNAPVRDGAPPRARPSAPVHDDDLARALALLACNPRDRAQFVVGRVGAVSPT